MHRLLLAGLLGLWAATASAQPIKIGELGIVADAPFYIAIEGLLRRRSRRLLERSPGRPGDSAALDQPDPGNRRRRRCRAYNAAARDWPVRIVMARTRD
jgi:hypothetical protein